MEKTRAIRPTPAIRADLVKAYMLKLAWSGISRKLAPQFTVKLGGEEVLFTRNNKAGETCFARFPDGDEYEAAWNCADPVVTRLCRSVSREEFRKLMAEM